MPYTATAVEPLAASCTGHVELFIKDLPMSSIPQRGVLVVEDDADLRELFGLLFASENFRVFEADDGLVGLKTLQENAGAIDVVVTDLGLPGLGGIELIAKVRAAKPSLRIIGTSGFGAESVRAMVLQAGADEFFPKPFAVREIIDKVKNFSA
jgi:DNA-binding response OmpR family regulator